MRCRLTFLCLLGVIAVHCLVPGPSVNRVGVFTNKETLGFSTSETSYFDSGGARTTVRANFLLEEHCEMYAPSGKIFLSPQVPNNTLGGSFPYEFNKWVIPQTVTRKWGPNVELVERGTSHSFAGSPIFFEMSRMGVSAHGPYEIFLNDTLLESGHTHVVPTEMRAPFVKMVSDELNFTGPSVMGVNWNGVLSIYEVDGEESQFFPFSNCSVASSDNSVPNWGWVPVVPQMFQPFTVNETKINYYYFNSDTEKKFFLHCPDGMTTTIVNMTLVSGSFSGYPTSCNTMINVYDAPIVLSVFEEVKLAFVWEKVPFGCGYDEARLSQTSLKPLSEWNGILYTTVEEFSVESTNSSSLNVVALVNITIPDNCFKLVDTVFDCAGSQCTGRTKFESCQSASQAHVVLSGMDGECVLHNSEVCTIKFKFSEKKLKFIGTSENILFESVTVDISQNPRWKWECAPWCGIPWLEGLSAGWRWSLGVIALLLAYLISGMILVRAKLFWEVLRSASGGWATAFKTTFGFIGGMFLFPFSLFRRKKKKKKRRGDVESGNYVELQPKKKNSKIYSSKKVPKHVLYVSLVLCLVGEGFAIAVNPPDDWTDGEVFRPRYLSNWDPIAAVLKQTSRQFSCSGVVVSKGSVNTTHFETKMEIEMSPEVGNTACFSFDGRDSLKITTTGIHLLSGVHSQGIFQPKIQVDTFCACPTGSSHPCDEARYSCPEGSGNCAFAKALGSKGGCSVFDVGNGHYCSRFSMKGEKYSCSQFDLSTARLVMGLIVEYGDSMVSAYVDLSSGASLHTPVGVLSASGSFHSTVLTMLTTGTATVCGQGGFWFSRSPFMLSEATDHGSPGLFTGNGTFGLRELAKTALIQGTHCKGSSAEATATTSYEVFNFGNAIVSEASLSRRFSRHAMVHFFGRELAFTLVSPPRVRLLSSFILPATMIGDIASCNVSKISAVGSFNSTSSAVEIVASCLPGDVTVTVNGISKNFHAEEGYNVFFFQKHSSLETETVDVQICSSVAAVCGNGTGVVEYSKPVVVPFVQEENVFVYDPGRPGFWTDGLGLNLRPFSGFGIPDLPIWAEVLMVIASLIILYLVFFAGYRMLRKQLPRQKRA